MPIRSIIYDLDDTLLDCGSHYERAKSEFARVTSERTKLTPEFCKSILEAIDHESRSLPGAFGAERFPLSFEAASLALDVIAKRTLDEGASQNAREIGESVFTAEYKLYDGVYEMLQAYKQAGVQQFILTKGATWVQKKKLYHNNLYYHIFDPLHVYIDTVKTPQHIEAILEEHGLLKEETIMVGDNLQDDIDSAIKAGIQAVYVRGNPTNPINLDRYYGVVRKTTDLPSFVPLPVSV